MARKIVLDANSWIIGTLGFRIEPDHVVTYFKKYRNSEDPTIIKLFCDIVKRSKLSRKLPSELKEQIIDTLSQWAKLDNKKSNKSIDSALKFINDS